MYRRNQRKGLADLKKEKEERKVIIKQIRNPLSRRDEIKKNAEKQSDSWSQSNETGRRIQFQSQIAKQIEKNEQQRQQTVEKRRRAYVAKMEKAKKEAEENFERMIGLQEKEMQLLQSVQQQTMFSQECQQRYD